MTSAATAKIILFIALSLGPQSTPDTILATSASDNYSWEKDGSDWTLETKGLPADDWMEQRDATPLDTRQEQEFRAIARHQWSHNSVLTLEDGSQVLKRNGNVFYIQDAGSPNQKTFTVIYGS